MPQVIEDPHNIDGPVIVKYAGAKGGRGYFIARDYRDFRRNVDIEEEFTIQEYVLGCRYYLHFFFDPTATDGFQVQGRGAHAGKNLGRLELLSMDRRDESNVDEFYKLGSLRDLREMSLEPSFVVTGNQPVVIRESLLQGPLKWPKEPSQHRTIWKRAPVACLDRFVWRPSSRTNWNSKCLK